MRLQDKVVFYLFLLTVTQLGSRSCMPRSLRTSTRKRYLNNFGRQTKLYSNPTFYPTIQPSQTIKSSRNLNSKITETKNDRLVNSKQPFDYRKYSDTNDQKEVPEGSKRQNFQPSPAMLRKLKRDMKMKRKLNALKHNESSHSKRESPTDYTLFAPDPQPYCFSEIGTFPETQYPVNVMETWAPNYWHPLHISETNQQFGEFGFPSFNTKRYATDTEANKRHVKLTNRRKMKKPRIEKIEFAKGPAKKQGSANSLSANSSGSSDNENLSTLLYDLLNSAVSTNLTKQKPMQAKLPVKTTTTIPKCLALLDENAPNTSFTSTRTTLDFECIRRNPNDYSETLSIIDNLLRNYLTSTGEFPLSLENQNSKKNGLLTNNTIPNKKSSKKCSTSSLPKKIRPTHDRSILQSYTHMPAISRNIQEIGTTTPQIALYPIIGHIYLNYDPKTNIRPSAEQSLLNSHSLTIPTEVSDKLSTVQSVPNPLKSNVKVLLPSSDKKLPLLNVETDISDITTNTKYVAPEAIDSINIFDSGSYSTANSENSDALSNKLIEIKSISVLQAILDSIKSYFINKLSENKQTPVLKSALNFDDSNFTINMMPPNLNPILNSGATSVSCSITNNKHSENTTEISEIINQYVVPINKNVPIFTHVGTLANESNPPAIFNPTKKNFITTAENLINPAIISKTDIHLLIPASVSNEKTTATQHCTTIPEYVIRADNAVVSDSTPSTAPTSVKSCFNPYLKLVENSLISENITNHNEIRATELSSSTTPIIDNSKLCNIISRLRRPVNVKHLITISDEIPILTMLTTKKTIPLAVSDEVKLEKEEAPDSILQLVMPPTLGTDCITTNTSFTKLTIPECAEKLTPASEMGYIPLTVFADTSFSLNKVNQNNATTNSKLQTTHPYLSHHPVIQNASPNPKSILTTSSIPTLSNKSKDATMKIFETGRETIPSFSTITLSDIQNTNTIVEGVPNSLTIEPTYYVSPSFSYIQGLANISNETAISERVYCESTHTASHNSSMDFTDISDNIPLITTLPTSQKHLLSFDGVTEPINILNFTKNPESINTTVFTTIPDQYFSPIIDLNSPTFISRFERSKEQKLLSPNNISRSSFNDDTSLVPAISVDAISEQSNSFAKSKYLIISWPTVMTTLDIVDIPTNTIDTLVSLAGNKSATCAPNNISKQPTVNSPSLTLNISSASELLKNTIPPTSISNAIQTKSTPVNLQHLMLPNNRSTECITNETASVFSKNASTERTVPKPAKRIYLPINLNKFTSTEEEFYVNKSPEASNTGEILSERPFFVSLANVLKIASNTSDDRDIPSVEIMPFGICDSNQTVLYNNDTSLNETLSFKQVDHKISPPKKTLFETPLDISLTIFETDSKGPVFDSLFPETRSLSEESYYSYITLPDGLTVSNITLSDSIKKFKYSSLSTFHESKLYDQEEVLSLSSESPFKPYPRSLKEDINPNDDLINVVILASNTTRNNNDLLNAPVIDELSDDLLLLKNTSCTIPLAVSLTHETPKTDVNNTTQHVSDKISNDHETQYTLHYVTDQQNPEVNVKITTVYTYLTKKSKKN